MTLSIRIRGDRQIVRAENSYDLVGQMNRMSFDAQSDQRQWMREAAERAKSLTGMEVRSDTANHFLTDLLATGMVEEITDATQETDQ